jgi:hypothetical protein
VSPHPAGSVGSLFLRAAFRLPDGRAVHLRITEHVAVRLTERIRTALEPQQALVEIGRILEVASIQQNRPYEMRRSRIRSDFYIRLGDIWMPADLVSGVLVVKTVLRPKDFEKAHREQLLARRRRKEQAHGRRAAQRAGRPARANGRRRTTNGGR